MKPSRELLDTLRTRTEFRAVASEDGTIGYGTTRYPRRGARPKVKPGDTCTQEEAEEWFRRDVADAARMVDRGVNVPLTQNQYDALVMHVYTRGGLSLRLKQRLNAGDFEGALKALGELIYAIDKKTKLKRVWSGLVARRNEEIALFQSSSMK